LAETQALLVMKRQAGEKDWFAKKPVLNAFLESSFEQLAQHTPKLQRVEMRVLDTLLSQTVLEV
jgi:RNA repair pathway DNA polymerase beta family